MSNGPKLAKPLIPRYALAGPIRERSPIQRMGNKRPPGNYLELIKPSLIGSMDPISTKD